MWGFFSEGLTFITKERNNSWPWKEITAELVLDVCLQMSCSECKHFGLGSHSRITQSWHLFSLVCRVFSNHTFVWPCHNVVLWHNSKLLHILCTVCLFHIMIHFSFFFLYEVAWHSLLHLNSTKISLYHNVLIRWSLQVILSYWTNIRI